MRVLHFSVNEQNIKKSGDFSGIVKGSKGYLKAEFSFGSEWSRRKAAASFFTQGKEYAVPIIRNRCIVPDDVRRRLFPCAGCRSGKRTDHQNK